MSNDNAGMIYNFVKKNIHQKNQIAIGENYVSQVLKDMQWVLDNAPKKSRNQNTTQYIADLNKRTVSRSTESIMQLLSNNQGNIEHRNLLLQQQQGVTGQVTQRPHYNNQQQFQQRDTEAHYKQLQQQRDMSQRAPISNMEFQRMIMENSGNTVSKEQVEQNYHLLQQQRDQQYNSFNPNGKIPPPLPSQLQGIKTQYDPNDPIHNPAQHQGQIQTPVNPLMPQYNTQQWSGPGQVMGQSTQGQPMQEQPIQGQPMQGQQGQPMQEQQLQPMQGQQLPGQPMQGQQLQMGSSTPLSELNSNQMQFPPQQMMPAMPQGVQQMPVVQPRNLNNSQIQTALQGMGGEKSENDQNKKVSEKKSLNINYQAVGENPKTETYEVVINSQDRQPLYPSANNYKIPFEFKNVIAIELKSAEVPRSGYLINDYCRELYISERPGHTIKVTLNVGDYNPEDLANEIRKQMKVAGTKSTYEISISKSTHKFTFKSVSNKNSGVIHFQLFFTKSANLAKILGYEGKDYLDSLEYTAEKRCDVEGDRYIYLTSPDLQRKMRTSSSKLSPFCKITFDDLHNGIKYHTPNENKPEIVIFNPPNPEIKELSLQFNTHIGQLYNFEGVDHSLTFQVTVVKPFREVYGRN